MEIVGKYGADCVRLFLVNSPVVRADNLRFREEGVRDILTNVVLKWINSLNFYLGQVELFEQTANEKFTYDAEAPKSQSVMDRWILASCQTLIQHVDQEMAGKLFPPPRDDPTEIILSISLIYRHSSAAQPCRRSHKLVHPFQSDTSEGFWGCRGHSCCSQHPLRDAIHSLPDLGESRLHWAAICSLT